MQHAVAQQRPFGAALAVRTAGSQLRKGSRQPQRLARAAGNGAASVVAAEFAEGQRVKVTAPIKVYHVGKFKGGLDLQGMEGVVIQPNVNNYKHHDGKQHELSANLPIKVQFAKEAPDGSKDVKIIAHLTDEEIEAL